MVNLNLRLRLSQLYRPSRWQSELDAFLQHALDHSEKQPGGLNMIVSQDDFSGTGRVQAAPPFRDSLLNPGENIFSGFDAMSMLLVIS